MKRKVGMTVFAFLISSVGIAQEVAKAAKQENAKEFQNLNLNYDSLQKEVGSPTKLDRKSNNDIQNQKQMKAFQEKKLDQTINKIVVVEDCSNGKTPNEAKKCVEEKTKNR